MIYSGLDDIGKSKAIDAKVIQEVGVDCTLFFPELDLYIAWFLKQVTKELSIHKIRIIDMVLFHINGIPSSIHNELMWYIYIICEQYKNSIPVEAGLCSTLGKYLPNLDLYI